MSVFRSMMCGQRRVVQLIDQRLGVGVFVEVAVAVPQRLELLGQDRLFGLAQRRAGQVVLAHQPDKQFDVVDVAVNLLQLVAAAGRSR